MTSGYLQKLLASIFIGLGGWCLFWPATVETLVLKPEFQHLSPTSALLFGCFGAQAVLVGILIATSDFKPRTFLIFGVLGSIPFFIFNWYFYFVAEMFTKWMLLDFVGNLGILTIGLIGYSLRKRELSTAI